MSFQSLPNRGLFCMKGQKRIRISDMACPYKAAFSLLIYLWRAEVRFTKYRIPVPDMH